LGGGIGQLKGVRGAGMRVFGPLTALSHLITGEEKYALAGRRWILRAALSDDWRAEHGGPADRPHAGEIEPYWSSFSGWYPRGFAGYMNHPFVVADSAFGVVVSYDLLYHCFTDAEKELIEQAFVERGTYILADTLRHARDFYVKMNQGILFAMPLLMETAFLQQRDPVYADLHAWTLAFMDEFARGPWNEEGVFGEGPGYGVGTLEELVEAFPILAACHDARIEDLLAPELPQIMTYLLNVRSTWDDERFKQRPHFLGLSDGSEENWIHPAILAFYVRYLRNPVAQYLWNESYADKELQGLPTLLSLGEEMAPAEPALPPAHVYRDQPMVFFRTGWRPGDTLVCLNAIRHVTCHGHKDRGAVIFEYNGEALLPDPGMIGYSEPASAAYHETFCHSTITFSQRSQLGGMEPYATAITDFFSTSGDQCPGNPAGIDWASVDLTAVYPQAARVQRHVLFLRPEVCLLYDEVEAIAEEQIEVNFTCLAEPRRQAESGSYLGSTGRNHPLLATISDGPLTSAVSNWSTHWPEIPSYRLVWATEWPVKTARFVTVLAPWPVGGPELHVTPIREGDLLGFEIQAGARTETFVTASRGGLEWQGLSTDGRALVARQQGGGVVAAASLTGAQIRPLMAPDSA
jgi:hypothetical protein